MYREKFALTPKNEVKFSLTPKNDIKFSLTPKNEVKDLTGSSFPSFKDGSLMDPIDVSSSSSTSSDGENDLSNDDASKQLVLYDHVANGSNTLELVPDPLHCEPPLLPRSKPPISAPRVLPSVAREWRPDVSCDDPEDISQDGNRIWAIDKPSIARPPAGWQRLLRIRAEGSTKFADIYYIAPSGKRLRSMVEIQKYLMDHPEYMTDGVSLSRFSFQIPRPLQENYVRKRSARLEGSSPVELEEGIGIF